MERFGPSSRLVTIGRMMALMVFKSIRGSWSTIAATCVVSTWDRLAKQDHPAYILCSGCRA
jgi:hypothetical protein